MLLKYGTGLQTPIPSQHCHCGWSTGLLSVKKGNNSMKLDEAGLRKFGSSAFRVSCKSGTGSSAAASRDRPPPMLRPLLSAILQPYLSRNPVAVAALDTIQQQDGGPIYFDHFAFRTFGVDWCGISSMAAVFLDLGYTQRERLDFEAKKLKALWFSPPLIAPGDGDGDGVDGPLPRIFVSELLVENLSEEAQAIVEKYTRAAAPLARHAALSSCVGTLPWPLPSLHDYQLLAGESEYAAWTLLNGYALNHAAIAVHALDRFDIRGLNTMLEKEGVQLSGGLKVSPDGGLLQSSTVADKVLFSFRGEEEEVSASYLEFSHRLVLAEFAHLRPEDVREHHRRDGFEVGNADKIFESTYSKPMSTS